MSKVQHFPRVAALAFAGLVILTVVALAFSRQANASYLPPGAVQLSSTNGSATITTGGTFQTLLAQNTARQGCFIQNPTTATEVLYIYVYSGTTGTPTVSSSIGLIAGASFNCAVGGYGVITDQVAVEAATTGHAFVMISQ